jgi:hypothetical protein
MGARSTPRDCTSKSSDLPLTNRVFRIFEDSLPWSNPQALGKETSIAIEVRRYLESRVRQALVNWSMPLANGGSDESKLLFSTTDTTNAKKIRLSSELPNHHRP